MADPKAVFEKYDVNQDGTMCSKELEAALKDMEISASPEFLKEIMAQYDKDKNGSLEFHEFKKVIADMKAIQVATVADVRDLFKSFDKDGSGYIEKAELREVLTVLGVGNDEHTVQAMIAAADTNNDGRVSIIEFSRIIGHGDE
ncbi:PREDICTED: calmodulin-like protein 3 [Branchiostoma belcheri]|uniref:Calmodulin-like protein 3 n=1 Tax=Branchiostoma belcheri TaxID=7741 RepID=A0A6P4XIE1_BRABE|nr:PREDICTED: calmodulin-like protein 3 [Branchiostoma belcheri]